MTVEAVGSEVGPELAVRRLGAWSSAGVAVAAFASHYPFAGVGRVPLRLLFWLQFAVSDRRSWGGTAVCALGGASWRPLFRAVLATGVGLAVLVGVAMLPFGAWVVWAAVLTMLWLYRRLLWAGLVGVGVQRTLRRARPAGRRVLVHTVASVAPGSGAQLMESVAVEADRRGWVLVLDAANPRLARYYTRFGFAAAGPPVAQSSGASAVPMARPWSGRE